jgi:hypothetical protein
MRWSGLFLLAFLAEAVSSPRSKPLRHSIKHGCLKAEIIGVYAEAEMRGSSLRRLFVRLQQGQCQTFQTNYAGYISANMFELLRIKTLNCLPLFSLRTGELGELS